MNWEVVLTPVMIAIAATLQQVTSYYREKQAQLRAQKSLEVVATAAATSIKTLAKTEEIGVKAKVASIEAKSSLNQIHTLVNNQMSVALREIAELRTQLAALKPDDLLAKAAADASTKLADERDAKQAQAQLPSSVLLPLPPPEPPS